MNQMNPVLGLDSKITLLASGLIFLLALVLGVWKYRQIMASDDHRAHPYVDIAHRASLLYAFATLLVAVFVALSGRLAWINLTAAMRIVFFFVSAIIGYIGHGLRRDTVNQFEDPDLGVQVGMAPLIPGETDGFSVLLDGTLVRWIR
jgi:hypothetical protein